MIQVRFSTSEFNPDTQEWVEVPVAELIADEEEVTIVAPMPTGSALTSRSSTPRRQSMSREAMTRSAGHSCSRSPTATAS